MKRNIFLLLFFFPIGLCAQVTYRFQGLIVDSINHTPIDYTNIGIEGKNLGTVSNDSGEFGLEIPDKFLNDSLTFSRIGYTAKKMVVGELVNQRNIEINLKPKSTEIEEAKIVSKKLKRKTKGNVSRARSVVFALYTDSIKLGGEVGVFIRLPKTPTLIKDFNFYITANGSDSAKLRFNLYDGKKGVLGENLLKENIYFTLRKNDLGDYKFDLSEYNIYAHDDVFIAIENVAVYTNNKDKLKSGKRSPTILLSGTIAGSRGVLRKVSMGTWEELPMAVSPGFWITILK